MTSDPPRSVDASCLGGPSIGVVVEVFLAAPDDWQVWRGLRRAALAEAPAVFGSTLVEWSGTGDTEPRWRLRLASVALNLVLTEAGQPVGMVSATHPTPRVPSS